MLLSQYYLPMVKETPADAGLVSHQLMLRAGMIRQLASGLYTWLPLGLRVLQKVEAVVREEMARIGALEMLMPSVQPAELWMESGRWDQYGKELLQFQDRHERLFCYGPTHEEVITETVRGELKSYKQLPFTLYQIQTKFRDEIRPRFGVMRGREFIMKDAYSFHLSKDSLDETYQQMYQAYSAILEKLGLEYRAVLADTGSIGGHFSHEFQVLADAGEDVIAYSDSSDYAANLEKAEAEAPQSEPPAPTADRLQFATPGVKTIADLETQFGVKATQSVKTLIVRGADVPLVALVLRGDHELNTVKAEHCEAVAAPLVFATETEITAAMGAGPGSLGPVNAPMPVIVDREAAVLGDFVCGANVPDQHYRHVYWARDARYDAVADLRNVVAGDVSPDGQGRLVFTRGIEVGHIFQLGDKYSHAMNLTVLSENGKAVAPLMGCYGLGISRIVAAAIEQNHDDSGIIWPKPMAPFQVGIVPIQFHKSYRVRAFIETLYKDLLAAGVSVLLDDRKERPGVMFATMDLIGIPHRIVIGERGLDEGCVEYKARDAAETSSVQIDQLLSFIQSLD